MVYSKRKDERHDYDTSTEAQLSSRARKKVRAKFAPPLEPLDANASSARRRSPIPGLLEAGAGSQNARLQRRQ